MLWTNAMNDGTEVNPDLIPKPNLCISCRKDGLLGKEEILCNLTRADQQGEKEFECGAYRYGKYGLLIS